MYYGSAAIPLHSGKYEVKHTAIHSWKLICNAVLSEVIREAREVSSKYQRWSWERSPGSNIIGPNVSGLLRE